MQRPVLETPELFLHRPLYTKAHKVGPPEALATAAAASEPENGEGRQRKCKIAQQKHQLFCKIEAYVTFLMALNSVVILSSMLLLDSST